jgi:hypothetical protein
MAQAAHFKEGHQLAQHNQIVGNTLHIPFYQEHPPVDPLKAEANSPTVQSLSGQNVPRIIFMP